MSFLVDLYNRRKKLADVLAGLSVVDLQSRRTVLISRLFQYFDVPKGCSAEVARTVASELGSLSSNACGMILPLSVL